MAAPEPLLRPLPPPGSTLRAAGGALWPASWGRAALWLARLSFVVGLTAVTLASLLPGPEMPSLGSSDKLMHFVCYALLAGNGAVALGARRLWLPMGVALILFGGVLEGLQALMPERQSSLADGLANASGVVAGIAAVAVATMATDALRRRYLLRCAVAGTGRERAAPAAGGRG